MLMSVGLLSQGNNLAIGEWKSHLPQQSGNYVTQTPSAIVYSNIWNLIIIDKESGSPTFLSKVEGLSDVGIDIVEYDEVNDQLVVIYDDANIDLVQSDGAVINVPNIKLNTSIITDKRVNGLDIDMDGVIYLATGFGVVALAGSTGIFRSTTITDVRVNDIVVLGERLYAGTVDGLYTINLALPGVNVNDFGQWELIEADKGIRSLSEIIALEDDSQDVLVGLGNEVFRGDFDSGFNPFHSSESRSFDVGFINHTGETIVIGYQGPGFASEVFFAQGNDIQRGGAGCVNIVEGAEIDERGQVWYADGFPEIRRASAFDQGCERITFNSPFFHTASDIDIEDGIIHASDGGVSDNFQFLFSRNGVYVQDGPTWTNFNEFNTQAIRDNDLLSFFRIKADPFSDMIYVGSYWGGLMELNRESGEIMVFTQENSTLQGSIGDLARERVTGIAFDEEANLWVSVFGAAQPLNVRTPDGVWRSFDVDAPSTISNLAFDDGGNLWCTVSGANGGILIYDMGEDVLSSSDDRQRLINQNNSQIDAPVNEVTLDLSGDMWVATAQGPVIFDCGNDAITDDCQGIRRIVEVDSIAAFLLADQNITAIEIDGANQKWLGTENGIFVQSEDGDEQLMRFTQDNSPLFDDDIQDIAYEPISGEMYISTGGGMISMKTATSGGSQRNRASDIYAFPNPVEPNYFGLVAIKGLATDAEIRITDINGNLVQSSRALGGTASWDLTGLSGEPVETGVYLVFSNQSNSFRNPEGVATKILVIR
jgi:hypothetical protein